MGRTLFSRLIESEDFFLLELFRSYGSARRAEAIAMMKRIPAQKGLLIISPLYLARQLRCPGYWDVSSQDSLAQRMQQLLAAPRRCREMCWGWNGSSREIWRPRSSMVTEASTINSHIQRNPSEH